MLQIMPNLIQLQKIVTVIYAKNIWTNNWCRVNGIISSLVYSNKLW